MSLSANFFILLFAATTFSQVLVEAKWKCSNCGIHYKAIGCYKDDSRRPLPEQILNERDTTSIVYGGRLINWHDWDNYIEGFACRCAELAQKKGYSVFGLQFYGECWSGASLASSKAVGAATGSYDCIGPQYKPCSQFSRHCVGSQFKNFIYQIVPDCNLKLDGLGCYADRHQKGARPLPLYFLTDRDASLDISSKIIDWRNWDVYMPELACRCANKAKELGHNTFGLQYYGECWTGSKADFTYNKDGLSNQCIDKCYEPCHPYEKYCAGKQFTNYVYRLADAACEMKTTPLGCYKEVKSARALGTLLADEGNPANPIFTGNMLNVRKWGSEFPQFLCRCARAAKNRGFSVFGVDNKATCWGASGHSSYKKYGESSKCLKASANCPSNTDQCAGGTESTFVYQVIEPSAKKRSFIPKFQEDGLTMDDLVEV